MPVMSPLDPAPCHAASAPVSEWDVRYHMAISLCLPRCARLRQCPGTSSIFRFVCFACHVSWCCNLLSKRFEVDSSLALPTSSPPRHSSILRLLKPHLLHFSRGSGSIFLWCYHNQQVQETGSGLPWRTRLVPDRISLDPEVHDEHVTSIS